MKLRKQWRPLLQLIFVGGVLTSVEDRILNTDPDRIASAILRQFQASIDESPKVRCPDECAATYYLGAASQFAVQTRRDRAVSFVVKSGQVKEGRSGKLRAHSVVDRIITDVAHSLPTDVGDQAIRCPRHFAALPDITISCTPSKGAAHPTAPMPGYVSGRSSEPSCLQHFSYRTPIKSRVAPMRFGVLVRCQETGESLTESVVAKFSPATIFPQPPECSHMSHQDPVQAGPTTHLRVDVRATVSHPLAVSGSRSTRSASSAQRRQLGAAGLKTIGLKPLYGSNLATAGRTREWSNPHIGSAGRGVL